MQAGGAFGLDLLSRGFGRHLGQARCEHQKPLDDSAIGEVPPFLPSSLRNVPLAANFPDLPHRRRP